MNLVRQRIRGVIIQFVLACADTVKGRHVRLKSVSKDFTMWLSKIFAMTLAVHTMRSVLWCISNEETMFQVLQTRVIHFAQAQVKEADLLKQQKP